MMNTVIAKTVQMHFFWHITQDLATFSAPEKKLKKGYKKMFIFQFWAHFIFFVVK